MTSPPDASSAATAQRVYSTAPLDYTEQEMRLVELQQNNTSEKLKCILRPYPVEGPHPPYIALSYAWGSNVGYADIELNGICFSVARNLWHFLNQMRLCEKFQTYWIDAICIDQMNLRERNHQVQMMRQIYCNAESVYAWLGVEDKANHSNTAMTFLARREVFEANTVYTKRVWTPRQAKAMLSLCERPYWTRIWIVQELLLSKTVIIFCGSKEIPWYHFERFFGDIAGIVDFGWGQHTGVSLTFASAASKIVKVKCDWNKQSALPLVDLLHLCRDQRSTDVRDKVYALCGLANDSGGLEIDYGIAAKQLLVVVLEHTCTTLNTSLKEFKLREQLVKTGQLLREILKVYFDDQQLEALIISRALQLRFQEECGNRMSLHNTSPNATNASVSQEYQPTSNHMDMNNMPLYSANTLTSSVPYQAGAYAYDVPTLVPVNPYNTQQASYYSSNIPYSVSYTQSHDIQPLSTLPDVRHVPDPNVKPKGTLPAQSIQMYIDPSYEADLKRSTSKPTEDSGINFATNVDTLIRAIQSKQMNSPQEHEQKDDASKTIQKPRKRYQCSVPSCNKSFYQKTHLEIHISAHNSNKPFFCKTSGCGQSFSQLGNLKTHKRRHEGERPYSCDICSKTFTRCSNVQAHKIVHQQIKPFSCEFNNCNRHFTQLGNLKSHQNKFHAATLRYITTIRGYAVSSRLL